MIDSAQAHKEVQATFLKLRELYGDERYRMFADWLKALAEAQIAYMTECSKDKLPDAQVRLKQLLALHNALDAKDAISTGHVFD